jgi:2-oxoglutarate dehydrogenase E1 component
MATDRAEQSINGWNGDYVEALYQQWLADPASVEPQWQQFFQGFDLAARLATGLATETPDGGAASAAVPAPSVPAPAVAALPADIAVLQAKQRQVDLLIYHYRDIGHLAAELDPLGTDRPFPPQLTLEAFNLSDEDLESTFHAGQLPIDSPARLKDIVQLLEDTYCRHIGVEYMHIQDGEQRRWLQERMEPVRNQPPAPRELKLEILRALSEADGFENFCHTRYTGTKRFGLDGAESLIPMLDHLVELGPLNNVKEYVFGMAHRGRLNVLVNILHKTYDQIFTEFDEAWVEAFLDSGGDVKYHRGYSTEHVTRAGHDIHLSLSANPSHLESIDPVVLGRTRAKQRLRKDTNREQGIPILIHGDASFPGQGVVAECLNMMKLDGYTVGGTIHIIINNQVGFTTNSRDAHSGRYCTDIAKFVEAPIFHVNGDDPEACLHVARLALEFRQAFKHDVVIDLWCYRKYGHNEQDEPTYTQPLMYERIRKQKPVLKKYADRLIAEGIISPQQLEELSADVKKELDEAQTRTKTNPVRPTVPAFGQGWTGLTQKYSDEPVDTAVSKDKLQKVAAALGQVPTGFNLHKNLAKLLQERGEAIDKDHLLRWDMGEMLAYGSLLLEGHAVRLTGQDVERGTFSHRHAVVFDQKTGEGYDALNHIDEIQARFCVHNSPLTEEACVGFEYGYSLGDPNMLIIWEAQFGDFCNGAQVYFDQFLSSAEAKWQRFSGLCLFLPHGYEGAGPEHSSARMERFLTLCADNNMQVVYPTTPAQMFHMLRRQLKRNFRKPLVVLTPKSLLRNPKATSKVAELVAGQFQRVIDDATLIDLAAVSRVVLCTGKIYYDLLAYREQVGRNNVALVRVEQLYPFPDDLIRAALQRYPADAEVFWVQEEPKNMGAWRHMDAYLRERLDIEAQYIGREVRPSPAVASKKMHDQEQERILVSVLGLGSTGELPSPRTDGKAEKPKETRPAPAVVRK